MQYYNEIECKCLIKEVVEEVCEKVFRRNRDRPYAMQGQDFTWESRRRYDIGRQRLSGRWRDRVCQSKGLRDHMRYRHENNKKKKKKNEVQGEQLVQGHMMGKLMDGREVVNLPPKRENRRDDDWYFFNKHSD